MSTSTYKTVIVKQNEAQRAQEELTAVSTIYPGALVEITSAGKVQHHSNVAQNAAIKFALEDNLQGEGLDDTYAADDVVQVWTPQRGDMVFAVLNDGEDISIGDFLESAGNGFLQKHVADIAEGGSSAESVSDTTIYAHAIVGIAREALNLSGSSGAESSGGVGEMIGDWGRRILIEVL